MKVLTSRAVLAGVARRVGVNMLLVGVFSGVPVLLSLRLPLVQSVMALIAVLAILYPFGLWGTVMFAKWLIPKMGNEAAYAAVESDAKRAEWVVTSLWWG